MTGDSEMKEGRDTATVHPICGCKDIEYCPKCAPEPFNTRSAPASGGGVRNEDIWLIKKNGSFYRSDKCGYTTDLLQAGHYTREEAEREAQFEPKEISAHPLSEFRNRAESELRLAIAKHTALFGPLPSEGMRSALEKAAQMFDAIKQATIEGRVCDDVAWFSEIETLHDYCATAADQARAALADDGWRPMDDPELEKIMANQELVDLFIDEEFMGRVTDCFYGFPEHECGEAGQYCDSDWHALKDPGWVYSLLNETLHPPIAWRRPPAPPTQEKE